jgi:hypothetical protein
MSRPGDRLQITGDRLQETGYRKPVAGCRGTIPCLLSRVDRRLFRVPCNLSRVIGSLLCLGFSFGLCAEGREQPSSAHGEEFFIISSVNSSKQQLVLKRPTEVTLLVRVNEKTLYLDQQGGRLQLKDFRAGDTVYVALRSSAEGPPVVARIRKGLMTLEELRRRYLKGESGEE